MTIDGVHLCCYGTRVMNKPEVVPMLHSVRFIRLWGLLALLVVLAGLLGGSATVAAPAAQREAQPVVVYFF